MVVKKDLLWSEFEEDDRENLDFLLPEKQIIRPEEIGMKQVIEYKFNEEGNAVKITTTVRKIAKASLSKRALERRNWTKFGDAVQEDIGSRCTVVSTQEILLERPRASGTKVEETKLAGDSKAGGGVLKLCRACGKKGDHWTAQCPYKDLAPQTEGVAASVIASNSVPRKDIYVPPSKRGVVDGADVRRRNEENSVRVTNLSEDTREPDLLELFRTFGHVSRVYVSIDHKTGMSRGFGFVNFVNKEDAERAINKLNGYGYDNLILQVEWAAPRSN